MLEYISSPPCPLFAGSTFTFFVQCTTGQLYVTGSGPFFQLGLGKETRSVSKWTHVPVPEPVTSVVSYHAYTLILTKDGNVYQAGWAGSHTYLYTPTLLSLPWKVSSIDIVVGKAVSLFVNDRGELWEIGNEKNLVHIMQTKRIVKVVSSTVITSDGYVWKSPYNCRDYTLMASIFNVSKEDSPVIATIDGNTFSVKNEGKEVWCCGKNAKGELGPGHNEEVKELTLSFPC